MTNVKMFKSLYGKCQNVEVVYDKCQNVKVLYVHCQNGEVLYIWQMSKCVSPYMANVKMSKPNTLINVKMSKPYTCDKCQNVEIQTVDITNMT
jgi:hypothetical protein